MFLRIGETRQANTNTCSSGFNATCSRSGLSATVIVKFNATITDDNSVVDDTTYEAKIEYHWDGPTTTSTQTNEYAIGGEHSIEQTHVYGVSDGEFDAGYSVHFGEGAGQFCSGKIFSQYYTVTFDDDTNSCTFGDASELEITSTEVSFVLMSKYIRIFQALGEITLGLYE